MVSRNLAFNPYTRVFLEPSTRNRGGKPLYTVCMRPSGTRGVTKRQNGFMMTGRRGEAGDVTLPLMKRRWEFGGACAFMRLLSV